MGETLARVERLPAGDRTAVRAVLATITEGQRFDLERFPGEDAAGLAALDTLADLDRYTYLVAGCVGEFWTRLCVAHRPRLAAWDVAAMTATGVRFGKALQLTNVLRDVPADLHQGRCYLPARELAALGLGPRDLLDTQRTPAARPLLDRLLRLALEHYDAAWRYTLAIPRAEWRLRLACAWPLLIGLGTLAAIARHPNPLAVVRPIKISRGGVRAILARSALAVWSDAAPCARYGAARTNPLEVGMERMMDGGGYGSDPITPGSEMGMPLEERPPRKPAQKSGGKARPKKRATKAKARGRKKARRTSRPRAKARKSSKRPKARKGR